VGRLAARVLDFLTIDPLRIRSVLRLVLIALIALLIYHSRVEHRFEGVFNAVLVVYTLVAVAFLVVVLFGPDREWFGWVSTAVDVVIVMALCMASGPGTIALYPIFFLLPISVAFLERPLVTGLLGVGAALGYLLAWLVYATGNEKLSGRIPVMVYVQVGCLLWLTAAITALSYTLARRQGRVLALLEVRRRLVAESMRADERSNRQLSEQLHDGPLQNLLAARLDLDELREGPTDAGFDRLDAALRETVSALRTTVSTLHPQVLEQVGLSAAVGELAQVNEQRWGTPVRTELTDVGRPESQTLIYRAARELLANALKHARATRLDVTLRRESDATVLRVIDDGVGFDPTILDDRVAEGHIGLASLVVGIEAAGGAIDIDPRPGQGTVVTVTVPDKTESVWPQQI